MIEKNPNQNLPNQNPSPNNYNQQNFGNESAYSTPSYGKGIIGKAFRERDYQMNSRNNQGWIDPNDDEYAAKTYAQIVRGQYNDYVNRFRPYEDRLMSLADSRELLDQQLGRITTNINNSYENPQFNAGRLQQQRYGISQSAQSKEQNGRQNNLNQALSVAHARNNTRVADGDRRFNMVTGADGQRANVMRSTQGG